MTNNRNGQIVGVDVGGTFTDLVLIDQKTKSVSLAKVPSTMDNQAYGLLSAMEDAINKPLDGLDMKTIHNPKTKIARQPRTTHLFISWHNLPNYFAFRKSQPSSSPGLSKASEAPPLLDGVPVPYTMTSDKTL